LTTGAPQITFITLSKLRAMRRLPRCDYVFGDPNRIAYVVYTSGTSGKPRAIAHAHRAVWARRMMIKGWSDLRQQDRMFHAGAFNWTYTLGTGLMDPWSIGATALIPAPDTNADRLPDLLAAHKVTVFAAAPGVFRKLIRCDVPDLPKLRHALSAGEKMSEKIRSDWQRVTGKPVYEAYGLSECSTFISGSSQVPVAVGALGRPQIGRRAAIVDNTGSPVPMGKTGVIAIDAQDAGLMLGYLAGNTLPDLPTRNGWFLTGDQGIMGVDGQITYQGRNDDMMNAGGYRVSPIEVETVIARHPDIFDVAVTDVNIKADVQIIVAFYCGPAPLDAAALDAYVAPKLARYKQPRAYVYVPELPRGPNGKLLRRALRAQFKAHNQ
jgi:acyl-coenzyme A synthetase/AMP-(fatty) acid ligase